MLRVVLCTARLVAVHNPRVAADLRQEYPGTAIEAIHLGTAPLAADAAARARLSTATSPGKLGLKVRSTLAFLNSHLPGVLTGSHTGSRLAVRNGWLNAQKVGAAARGRGRSPAGWSRVWSAGGEQAGR